MGVRSRDEEECQRNRSINNRRCACQPIDSGSRHPGSVLFSLTMTPLWHRNTEWARGVGRLTRELFPNSDRPAITRRRRR